MKLSIVIPVHNEEGNIVNLINRIEQTVDLEHELVIINDHSTDATCELIRSMAKKYNNIKLVENTLDKGFANALKIGFDSINTEVVVPVMGDLCDDLSSIRQMLNKLNQGYDVVCGSRYIKGGARIGGSKIKGFLSRLGGKSLHYLLGFPTHDIANAFKMYRKSVLDAIDIKSKGFEISMEIPLKGYYKAFKMTEIPTVWKERQKGKSNFHMLKLFPAYLNLYLWAVMKRFTG